MKNKNTINNNSLDISGENNKGTILLRSPYRAANPHIFDESFI